MTKKRIRQMNSALRRRLTGRPAADWLPQGESFARRLETEGYMQRLSLINNTQPTRQRLPSRMPSYG